MRKTCMRAAAVALMCMGATGWAVAQTAAVSPAPAAPTTPAAVPIKSFFGPTSMARPVLSPDGKRMAVLAGNEVSGRRDLVVLNFGPPLSAKLAARFSDADVAGVHWVNNERLVFTLADSSESYENGLCPGLWAVDHDGSNSRRLVKNNCWRYLVTSESSVGSRELSANHRLVSVLRDGSADVVIERLNFDNRRELRDTTALRLNTVTGQTVAAAKPGYPDNVQHWEVDLQGRPRLVVAAADGKATIHWRATDDEPWQAIATFDRFLGGAGGFNPLQIGPDDVLYATAWRNDEARTSALFRFDRKALKLEREPLVGVTGFDFLGTPVFDHAKRRLVGVHYLGDAAGTVWFDDEMKQLQARIDKRLPGLVNILHVSECGDCTPWIVVETYSDRQPPLFLLWHRQSDTLQSVGSAKPAIPAKLMAQRDFVRFPARDGLSIPMHITKPAGKGPWPAVVLLHGGPWVRGGSWAWTSESQFLASRGYLVLEPEFRGSDGYGYRHVRAGFKEWGLKMQDDVSDATRWAIDQKLSDPLRICLAGASYGGYSTLMGLIREPELYRCGVAWAAVTDIDLMYDITWSDLPDAWKKYGMPNMIGDQVKDAAQLEQASPLKQAHRLKQPLMLAFGAADLRVPIDHGSKFRDTVRKTNSQVEWVVYDSEGHGFFKPENRFDFYGRMEKFLATHLQAK
jgi:dienelactone hydrolase